MNCHEAAHLLDAYVDHELDASQSAVVGEHIAQCAACGERLARLESLGRLVRSLPNYPAPSRLRATVAAPRHRVRVSATLLAWAAAIIVAVSLGGRAGVRSWQEARATSLTAEDVVNSHVQALRSDPMVHVRSSNQHTVKPWFQGKLDFSPPVTDLSSSGFALVGGRVDVIAGRTVASLVYQRREHIIDVFVWPAGDRAAAADARTIRGFQERHWLSGGMSLWAVSDLNDAEMNEFVRLQQAR
jgi:anti-sigma factor RsiW